MRGSVGNRFAAALFGLVALTVPARACGVSAQLPSPVRLAAVDEPDEQPGSVAGLRFTFLGHASFLIETPGRVSVVTDYNGVNIPADPPTIATMNHAHSTHYTLDPDPRIKYILHGWRDDGGPAHIDLTVGDLHVRNLPTNIRSWDGGTEMYGNSVFVFESAGLCVAHLGHLHHLLTQDDLDTIGPIDIAIVPVDGMWTMSHEDMATVVDALHASVTIPMHYYTRSVLNRFLTQVRDRYPIREAAGPVMLSRTTLPATPEILILPGPPG